MNGCLENGLFFFSLKASKYFQIVHETFKTSEGIDLV